MRNVVNSPSASNPIVTNTTVPFPSVAGNVGFNLSEIVNACSTVAADISISTGSFSIWYPSGALVSQYILQLFLGAFLHITFNSKPLQFVTVSFPSSFSLFYFFIIFCGTLFIYLNLI